MPAKGVPMTILAHARGISRARPTAFHRALFGSPQPKGRKITVGFSYLQRIGKLGTYDVWFPDELKSKITDLQAAGHTIGPEHFPAQWAAVRQIELFHESGNHKIYDLKPERFERAMMDLTKGMRAGGYRMVVATLGNYEETSTGDELEILDRRLQEGIATLIHMLYLEQESLECNRESDALLASDQWDYRRELPHVGMVLGAADLFRRPQSYRQSHKIARHFFDILNKLPQTHIVHDTALGLQLPELIGENQWNYIADPEETLGSFNRVLSNVYDKFNGISLSRLNGHADAHDEIKSSTFHMRGYGDRLNSHESFYQQAAFALG